MAKGFLVLVVFCLFASSFLFMANFVYAVNVNAWEPKASLHQARAYLSVAVVDGKIYAIGGDNGSENVNLSVGIGRSYDLVATNEEYDPTTDHWTTKASMPTPRALFGIATYQGKIYCIGGYNANSNLSINEVYDPNTDTWSTKAAMPSPAYGVQANTVGTKIYVIGGDMSMGPVSTNVNYAYDPATDSWASKTAPPNDLASSGSAVVGNKIYFIGALADARGYWNGTYVVQAYDTVTDSWSIVAPSPRGFESGNGGAVTSGAYAPKQIYFFDDNVTHVFDLASNNWTIDASMLIARKCVGIAVLNDTFYVIGGRSGIWGYITMMDATAAVEQFTPWGYRPDVAPPKITLIAPRNTTYTGDVSLIFRVDKEFSWMGYSLDAWQNVTVAGNMTLHGLSEGPHSIVVYANGTTGSIGLSNTVYFSIWNPNPTTTSTPQTISPSTSPTPTPSPTVPEFSPLFIAAPLIAITCAIILQINRKIKSRITD
jgi:N-acetylneuraminic acid mutarotase